MMGDAIPGRRSRRWIVTGAPWGLGVVVVAAVAVVLVDIFAGPFVFLSTKLSPPELRDGAHLGAIEGEIKRTEADSSTVLLPHGFLGLRSLPVVVTEQTRIAIGGKLGGFGDLEPGRMVRIAYEVSPDRLVARRIEVLDPNLSSAEADQTDVEQPAFALPRASAPTTVNHIVPRVAPPQTRAPVTASSAALKEARRSERLPAPRAATPIQPVRDLRPVERVIVSPAPPVSHASEILRVSPPAPSPSATPGTHDRPIVHESKQAP
jgi:hypothetical protein